MSNFKAFIAIASILTLSTGVTFATDLHKLVPPNNQNPGATTAAPGQTGSNVLSSCGATSYFSIGTDAMGNPIKTSPGRSSPFNPSATKTYAGNTGNPATNPNAVSQYDNACAQAALRAGQLP